MVCLAVGQIERIFLPKAVDEMLVVAACGFQHAVAEIYFGVVKIAVAKLGAVAVDYGV